MTDQVEFSPRARDQILQKIKDLNAADIVVYDGVNKRDAANNRHLFDYLNYIQFQENPPETPEEEDKRRITANEWNRKFTTGRAKDYENLWITLLAFIHQFDRDFEVDTSEDPPQPEDGREDPGGPADAPTETAEAMVVEADTLSKWSRGRTVVLSLTVAAIGTTAAGVALYMKSGAETPSQAAPTDRLSDGLLDVVPIPLPETTDLAEPSDTAKVETDPKVIIPMPNYYATAMDFSEDGKLIAIADGSLSIRVYFAETGLLAASLRGHEDTIRSLDISPDGDFVASGAEDGTARIWSIAQKREVRQFLDVRKPRSMSDDSTLVSFSPDGTRLATGGLDHVLSIYNVGEGALERRVRTAPARPQTSSHGDTEACAGQSLALSPECVRALRSSQNSAKVLRRSLNRGLQPIQDIAFSADGRFIGSVSFGPDGDVQLLDLEDDAPPAQIDFTTRFGLEPIGISFSPAAQQIAVLGKTFTSRAATPKVAARFGVYDIEDDNLSELGYRGAFQNTAGFTTWLGWAPDFSWDGALVSFPLEYGYVVYDVEAGLLVREKYIAKRMRHAQLGGSAPLMFAGDLASERSFEIEILPFQGMHIE